MKLERVASASMLAAGFSMVSPATKADPAKGNKLYSRFAWHVTEQMATARHRQT